MRAISFAGGPGKYGFGVLGKWVERLEKTATKALSSGAYKE
jgi:hypothetical protein